MSKIWMLALVLAVGACDCGDGDPNPPGDDCEEDADCTDPVSPWCVMERCVQCRDEADCAAGQSCSGTNMCMGDTLDGSMDDTGVVDAGDDSAVECVGAPPACCDPSSGTVDSECVGDTYVCPSGTTEGACVAGPLWSATYGMELDDMGEDIVVDGAGNIYVTGWFLAFEGLASPIDFGGGELTAAGGSDGFIASFDADGVYRWAQGFGGTGFDTGTALAVDSSDNVYVSGGVTSASIDFGGGALTGGTNGDGFIASFTSDGTYRWARRLINSGSNRAHAVAVSGTRVIVAGGYDGAIDLGDGAAGTAGAFVASYAEDGTYQWAQRFGDNRNTSVEGVVADGAGSIDINGSTRELSLDFGGGDLDSVGGNQPDQFLASFSATDGSYRWARRFGDSGSEFGGPIAVDSANNVYMIGGFDSADYGGGVVTKIGDGRDVVLASYDNDGVYRWDVTWDASDARSVVVDASDNVYVTGFFSDAVDFGGGDLANAGGADVYLVSVQPDGTFRFSLGFGPAMNQTGTGVAIDDSGIYLSADFDETIDFGDGEHTGLEDIALVKLPLP